MDLKLFMISTFLQSVTKLIGPYVDGITLTSCSDDVWEGSNVTFNCTNQAHKFTGIVWVINNLKLAMQLQRNGTICQGYDVLANPTLFSYSCPDHNTFSVTLKNITRSRHGETWTCQDIFGNESNSVRIFVKVPAHTVTIFPKKHVSTVMENKTFFPFQCTSNVCRPEPVIKWYTDNNTNSREDDILFGTSLPVSLQTYNIQSYTSELKGIANRSLNGWYLFCVVNNSLDEIISDKILLNITYPPDKPPRIAELESAGEYRVMEGRYVTLTCSAAGGNPLPLLHWSRRSNESQTLTHNTITKTISWQAHRADDDNLACTSIHLDKNETTRSQITVLYAAKVLYFIANNTSEILTINEDYTLNVTCEIEGNPIPEGEIKFQAASFVGNNLVKEKTTITSIQTSSKLHLTTSLYAKCTDTGQYMCTGWNEFYNGLKTTSVRNVTLLVKCKPRKSPYHEISDRVFSTVSRDVTLSFIALAYPVPSESGYVWSKKNVNGEWTTINVTSNEDKIIIATSGLTSELTIKNITELDYGLYKLMVENDVGTYEHTFSLTAEDKRESFQLGLAATSAIGRVSLLIVMVVAIAVYKRRYKKVRYAYQEWPHPANTASPHSQKVERRRQHGYNQFQNRRHKQLTKVRTRGAVSGKTNCHWGFKPGSRVHQPHTCPNRFSYQQTSTSCLGEITPTHPSAQQCCMQKHTNI